MTNRFICRIIKCPPFPKEIAPVLRGRVNPIHLRRLLFSFCQGSVNIALAAGQFQLKSQWKILKMCLLRYPVILVVSWGFWVSLAPAWVRKYIQYQSILSFCVLVFAVHVKFIRNLLEMGPHVLFLPAENSISNQVLCRNLRDESEFNMHGQWIPCEL